MKALEVHMKILYTNYRTGTHFIPMSKYSSGLKEYLYHMQFGSFLLFLSLLSFLIFFVYNIRNWDYGLKNAKQALYC